MKEKDIFKYVIRPFIIYCISVVIITCIGSNIGTLSSDTVDGYIYSMILCAFINYLNAAFIDLSNINKEYKDNNNECTKEDNDIE